MGHFVFNHYVNTNFIIIFFRSSCEIDGTVLGIALTSRSVVVKRKDITYSDNIDMYVSYLVNVLLCLLKMQ